MGYYLEKENNNWVPNYPQFDTILEYDIIGDSIREIGRMWEKRINHAITVVQSADFSQWWLCQ